ncbi:fasciclin domain-containing protein [Flavobacterium piscis]|uniref:Surface protein with fasciclin (FAS1) repeats n=1 Tax=Flavobacterium piscis TaxID=1114874 RepID=A0ABU1Y5F0_9FLAO|nr:fasciclin domain-containing protein [Flavobacterium piscis]MDR7209451.1 putative surface protein with fasciclin (FAS1) repeats [Flavobacterium piscis]
MNTLKLIYKTLFAGILTIALVSCSDPWSDRENNGDNNLNSNLSEAISATSEVSKFGELLTKTGYDKILSASKTYTVFAPVNEAIDQLDASILNNPEALSAFVANHIALTSYSSVRNEDTVQIKMLSEKYLNFKGNNLISDATIVSADHYAKNGVFHIINHTLAPKMNIWEYIKSQTSSSSMSNYLVSLNELNIYDSDIAAKENAIPGVFADSLSNSFLKNVYNVNNEKNSYTLFLIEDEGYDTEVDKLKPYLNKPTADSTTTYSRYFTIRDMVFPKAYRPNELPNELTTRFGVNVPIDKTQIIGEPVVLSNGIIYHMKKVDVPLVNRLVPTKIEGEKNTSFFPADLRSKILYRDLKDPSGVLFNDIYVKNTKVSNFQLRYFATDLYSTTYQVYWRAINNQPTVFQQKVAIINGGISQDIPYTNVAVNFYDEVYIGELSLTQAGSMNTFLLANTTTADGTNSLTLDYLKFVPVVK